MQQSPPSEFKILNPRLHGWGLPRYQSDMAAAIDLHACLDEAIEILPGDAPHLISAGFALHMANANSPHSCCRAPDCAIRKAWCSAISWG